MTAFRRLVGLLACCVGAHAWHPERYWQAGQPRSEDRCARCGMWAS